MDAPLLGLERRRLSFSKAIGVRKVAFTAAYLYRGEHLAIRRTKLTSPWPIHYARAE